MAVQELDLALGHTGAVCRQAPQKRASCFRRKRHLLEAGALPATSELPDLTAELRSLGEQWEERAILDPSQAAQTAERIAAHFAELQPRRSVIDRTNSSGSEPPIGTRPLTTMIRSWLPGRRAALACEREDRRALRRRGISRLTFGPLLLSSCVTTKQKSPPCRPWRPQSFPSRHPKPVRGS